MKLSANQWHCKQQMTEEINNNKIQYFKKKNKIYKPLSGQPRKIERKEYQKANKAIILQITPYSLIWQPTFLITTQGEII